MKKYRRRFNKTYRTAEQGFTLIELSIVLVIIGLIVGGVLVGRDMIHASELRATVTQVEQFRTAMYTFRDKYGGIPGDLRADLASRFGFVARSGLSGEGDGNDKIEDCNTGAFIYAGCENALFWRDLSQAALIPFSFSSATNAPILNLTAANASRYYPTSKYSKNVSVIPSSYYEVDCFTLTKINGTTALGLWNTLVPVITPTDALSIEMKLDDGAGATGKVFASGTSVSATLIPCYSTGTALDYGAAQCMIDVNGTYNTANATYANSQLCSLKFSLY